MFTDKTWYSKYYVVWIQNYYKQAENGLQSQYSKNGKTAVWHYQGFWALWIEIEVWMILMDDFDE